MRKIICLTVVFLLSGCFYYTTSDEKGHSEFGRCGYSVKLVETTHYGIFTSYKISAPGTSYDGAEPFFHSRAEEILATATIAAITLYQKCMQQPLVPVDNKDWRMIWEK